MTKQDITLYNAPVLFIDEADTEIKELKHTYWLNASSIQDVIDQKEGVKQLQGITQTILMRALGDPYAAMANDARATANKEKAAQRGSNIHEDVQTLFNFGGEALTLEGRNCIREFDARGWQHIASEYVVSDEEDYASSIDLLFLNEKGELCIGDIKTYAESTAKQQLQRVALQCAVYNLYFSLHNNYKVKHHYEIRLREQEVDIIELPMINPVVVGELLTACKTGDEKYQYNPTPSWYLDEEKELEELLELQKQTEERIKEMKAKLLERMNKEKIKTLRNNLTVSIVKGGTTAKVDTKKFELDHPERAIDFIIQTFDEKSFKAAAKKDEYLARYITETTREETIRIA